jgi:hypothetical protein
MTPDPGDFTLGPAQEPLRLSGALPSDLGQFLQVLRECLEAEVDVLCAFQPARGESRAARDQRAQDAARRVDFLEEKARIARELADRLVADLAPARLEIVRSQGGGDTLFQFQGIVGTSACDAIISFGERMLNELASACPGFPASATHFPAALLIQNYQRISQAFRLFPRHLLTDEILKRCQQEAALVAARWREMALRPRWEGSLGTSEPAYVAYFLRGAPIVDESPPNNRMHHPAGGRTPPHPDGPEPPCWLRWKGKRIKIGDGRSARSWRLLNYFWNHESATYEDLCEGADPDKPWDRPVHDGTIASAVNRMNQTLPADFPWSLSTLNRCVEKQSRENPAGETRRG